MTNSEKGEAEMQDKLQVISMRTNPNARDARIERIVDMVDKWMIGSVIVVTVLAVGVLIGMKLVGG